MVFFLEPSESKGVKTEAIVGGVVGAIVFIVIMGLVINCYRKKKRKGKIIVQQFQLSHLLKIVHLLKYITCTNMCQCKYYVNFWNIA